MGAPSIQIWTDFNALSQGRVPLFCNGGLEDIREQNVELREGLRIVVHDEECEAEAVVEKYRGKWYGRIVEGTLKSGIIMESPQLKELLGSRLRIHVDPERYRGHPTVPPGTVAKAIVEQPRGRQFLVIALDAGIEVRVPPGQNTVEIRYLVISPMGWDFCMLGQPHELGVPFTVEIWHVYDPILSPSVDLPNAMRYATQGTVTRIPATP